MKISFLTPSSQVVEPWIPIFQQKGVEVLTNSISEDCDFIVCGGQAQLAHLEHFHNQFPTIPIINYVWDFYKTVWEYPGAYDWKKYLEYIKMSQQVWCPSEEVITRLDEEGVFADEVDRSKCKLIKSWARFFDYEGEVKDNRYILQPMRAYPGDKNYGWLRRACAELQIPLGESNHTLSEVEFQKVIAECSFICTEYHEASTGGLTLLEGYKLGKPIVISDSMYMGARDYFGDRAIYFNDNSYEDFKQTIKETWENTPILDRKECEEFINTTIPTIEDMVQTMVDHLKRVNG